MIYSFFTQLEFCMKLQLITLALASLDTMLQRDAVATSVYARIILLQHSLWLLIVMFISSEYRRD